MAAVGLSVAFALVAAVCIGLNTFGVGVGLAGIERDRGVTPVVAAVQVSLVIAVVIFWAATAARGAPFEGVSVRQVLPLIAAGVLYPALFRLLYYTGIDRVGANVTSAVVAGNPAVAALLAVPVLGETFTTATAVGIACIAGGGALLQFVDTDPGADPADRDVIARELLASSPIDLLAPLAALLTVGVGYLLVKIGLTRFPHPIAATAVSQTAGLVAFTAYVAASADARAQLRVVAGHATGLAVFAGASAAAAVAGIAQFVALNVGTVGLVAPLVNTYPLVVAVLSYAAARQIPRSPRALGGVLAIVVGAGIIQL